jgi:hypothetical protein
MESRQDNRIPSHTSAVQQLTTVIGRTTYGSLQEDEQVEIQTIDLDEEIKV